MDKSDVNDLFALLLRLKSAWSALFHPGSETQPSDEEMARVRTAASGLYRAIQHACASGHTVTLFSPRGGGRLHVVRSVGLLNPDGITFHYSTEAADARHLRVCTLPAMTWIQSAPNEVPRVGPVN